MLMHKLAKLNLSLHTTLAFYCFSASNFSYYTFSTTLLTQSQMVVCDYCDAVSQCHQLQYTLLPIYDLSSFLFLSL